MKSEKSILATGMVPVISSVLVMSLCLFTEYIASPLKIIYFITN
jgi:hypothetical protein